MNPLVEEAFNSAEYRGLNNFIEAPILKLERPPDRRRGVPAARRLNLTKLSLPSFPGAAKPV